MKGHTNSSTLTEPRKDEVETVINDLNKEHKLLGRRMLCLEEVERAAQRVNGRKETAVQPSARQESAFRVCRMSCCTDLRRCEIHSDARSGTSVSPSADLTYFNTQAPWLLLTISQQRMRSCYPQQLKTWMQTTGATGANLSKEDVCGQDV